MYFGEENIFHPKYTKNYSKMDHIYFICQNPKNDQDLISFPLFCQGNKTRFKYLFIKNSNTKNIKIHLNNLATPCGPTP